MSLKDHLFMQVSDENETLKAKIKRLRFELRKSRRWAKALVYVASGDDLPPALEKEFGEILDKL